jgi:hypothetical protein
MCRRTKAAICGSPLFPVGLKCQAVANFTHTGHAFCRVCREIDLVGVGRGAYQRDDAVYGDDVDAIDGEAARARKLDNDRFPSGPTGGLCGLGVAWRDGLRGGLRAGISGWRERIRRDRCCLKSDGKSSRADDEANVFQLYSSLMAAILRPGGWPSISGAAAAAACQPRTNDVCRPWHPPSCRGCRIARRSQTDRCSSCRDCSPRPPAYRA